MCSGDQAEVRDVAWVGENSDEDVSAAEEDRVYPSPQHSSETEEVMTNRFKSKRKINDPKKFE